MGSSFGKGEQSVQARQEMMTKISIISLPEGVLSYILSFLHGFNIAGCPANTCQAFAASCRSPLLCQHLLDRDFVSEDALDLPLQPARISQHVAPVMVSPLLLTELLSEEASINIGASAQLRSVVRSLCKQSPSNVYIAIGINAAAEGRPRLLQWVATRCDLNRLNGLHKSAAMVAAAQNYKRTTAVAASVCNLEQHDGKFGTALHQAAYFGAWAAVSELLSARADLNARNQTYGQTPLHVACSRNHGEVCQVLLEAQAEPSDRDRDGLSAMRIAELMNSDRALRVLEQHEQDQL